MFPHFSTPPQKRKRREGFPPPLSGLYQGRLWEIQSSSLGGMVAWVECEYMASTPYFCQLFFLPEFENRKLCNESTLRGHAAMSLLDRGIMSDFARGSRRCCGLLGINPP